MRLVVGRAEAPLTGEVRVPGDKSIAHRWLIFACTAEGTSELLGLPSSLDVRSTAGALATLLPELRIDLQAFARATGEEDDPIIGLALDGGGLDSPVPPDEPLYCGNSGTTMRLMAGLLAAQEFESVLSGDASLSRRPMERVAQPLRQMGADVRTEDGHPPVTVHGGPLTGIEFTTVEPSAQVKSAVLIAGLHAEGETTVVERVSTRDHTERLLEALGAPITLLPGRATVHRFQHGGFRGTVPGDASAAAFLAGAAALVPLSRIVIRDVGLNTTRTGWIRHLERMGAAIEGRVEREELGEPVGSLMVEAAEMLRPVELSPAETAESIDEIPMLAAVAAHAHGESRFSGAGELRVKESDRLSGVAGGIVGLGGRARVEGDDLVIEGGGLAGGAAHGMGDHRLVMAFTVAALGARRECAVDDAEWAGVSFPGFASTLAALGARIEE
jgi:3-phosphoshikimate 1-carboxyvinyltransferase